MSEKTFDLLQRADILFKREGRLDIALVLNLPIALIFLPAADIPAFVSEGQVDLGITGIDQVQEHEAAWGLNLDDNILRFKPSRNDIIMNLGYGDCRLQVQVPEKSGITDSVNLIGRTIGTSFVSLTKQYFTALEAEQDPRSLPTGELQTKVIELTGSVEAACALGVADGIVDLVGELGFATALSTH